MTTLLPLTRAHALEDTEVARVGGTFSRVRDAGLQLDAANAMFGAVSWMTFNVFNLLCLMVAAWAYATRTLTLTVGDVVMLTAFFGSLTGSMMALLNVAPQVTRGLESLRSIGEVLQSPDVEHNDGKRRLDTVRGEFHFEHVGFAYAGEGAAVTDVTFGARPGEVIALVGPSGSGKSTLLNLVIGFVRPTVGRITLDGHDMAGLDLRSYRRFVSIVPQDPVMFDGSVRDNVTYGLNGVPESRVREALRHAHAEAFVDALPGGLDARVGERGAPLSGGQRQRIAIARALIRDPRVLILDEATSALDTESEAHVQRALAHLMRGRTTFVVAHRLSTVRTATRILVLGGGQVVEAGTHRELVQLNGHYARLHAYTQTN
ncbi:ABC transporter ATP-binding protein [Deinococcus sp. A31D244]|uniref:ABC transporter ATP-binding protein n=1 Tax=Deinococcus sp. A31D244 TaxID=3397675 RepID=UPI0039E04BAB